MKLEELKPNKKWARLGHHTFWAPVPRLQMFGSFNACHGQPTHLSSITPDIQGPKAQRPSDVRETMRCSSCLQASCGFPDMRPGGTTVKRHSRGASNEHRTDSEYCVYMVCRSLLFDMGPMMADARNSDVDPVDGFWGSKSCGGAPSMISFHTIDCMVEGNDRPNACDPPSKTHNKTSPELVYQTYPSCSNPLARGAGAVSLKNRGSAKDAGSASKASEYDATAKAAGGNGGAGNVPPGAKPS